MKTKVYKQLSRAANPKGGMIQVPSSEVEQVDATPNGMIMIALQAGRPMAEIQSLIDMRNAEIARLAKLSFNKAKSKFLELVPQLHKNRTADYGETKSGRQGANYKFSDLDNLINTAKEAEAAAGLSHDWKNGRNEKGEMVVTCILSHVDGHSESDSLSWAPDTSGGKTGIQAMKSTISYLRRATLEGLLGLSQGKDDNDGATGERIYSNTLLKPPTVEEFKTIMKSVSSKTVTVEEVTGLYALSDEQVESLIIASK